MRTFLNKNASLSFLDGEYYYLFNVDIPLAFTFGYISEKIILTKGILKSLSKEELKAVLLHEKGHIIFKHNIKKFFYNILFSSFSFFTFFEKLHKVAIGHMELEADRYALKMGITPEVLSNAILKVKSISINQNISSFGLKDRVELIYSNSDIKYTYNDIIKGIVCLILPWILLIINLFSSANACIVNPELMSKKNIKNKLICS